MISLAGAIGLAGAARANDAGAGRYSLHAPISISDARAFKKIVADPRVSLIDGHQTQDEKDARRTAWRALGLGGLSGFCELSDERLAMSEGSDGVDPMAPEKEGLAEFKARVIDDLIASLDGQSVLLSDEFSLPLDVALVNAQAVVDEILNTDASEWGDDVASADQSGDLDALADTSDIALDTKVLADIAGGNGPTQFSFSSGGQAYTAGHIADLVALTSNGRNPAFTSSSVGLGLGSPTLFAPRHVHRAHTLAAQPVVVVKSSAGQPSVSPAVVVPLPAGTLGAAAVLLMATAVASRRFCNADYRVS